MTLILVLVFDVVWDPSYGHANKDRAVKIQAYSVFICNWAITHWEEFGSHFQSQKFNGADVKTALLLTFELGFAMD